MTAEIINIVDKMPTEEVAQFTLCFDAQGKPLLCLTWASDDFINGHDTVSERFLALKEMVINATDFLDECARDFEGLK